MPTSAAAEPPFSNITRQANRLMDQMQKSYFSFCPSETWTPSVNLYETADSYLVCADLAGVDKSKIDVEVYRIGDRGLAATLQSGDMQRQLSSYDVDNIRDRSGVKVYTGTMDTYQLNNSTTELEKWMKTTENPHYEGFFLYGDRKPHCWSGPLTPAERLKEMAQFIISKKPEGATTVWWRY